MRAMFNWYFACYCILWLLIRLLRPYNCIPAVLNSYLTDCIAVPVLAHTTITIAKRYFTLSKNHIFIYLFALALYISIIFEILMPLLSSKYTSDTVDVFCYFAGALFYYCTQANTTIC